jgi:fatty acid desaturase
VLGRDKPSASSVEFEALRQKVLPLYRVNWGVEVLLMLFYLGLMLISVWTDSWLLAGLCSGLVQVTCGWMGHSMAHSRDRLLNQVGTTFVGLTCGYSLSWWSPKHNRHHMFTNSLRYDDDIKHEYKRYLFPLLPIKWRYDSIEAALRSRNFRELGVILLGYLILLRQNPVPLLLGQLVFGYYTSCVLIGNHEREVRFEGPWGLNFIEHQLVTSRDYEQEGWFWLLMMGGMQYQAEHHLFPQIPFYNLPAAVQVIRPWLKAHNKELIFGPVL